MSVKAILKDITLAANSSTARDKQYRDSVFDLTFNKITTTDECFSAIEDAILNKRKGTSLTANERILLEMSVDKAFKNVYTMKNIKTTHKKQGFKVFSDSNKHRGETNLAKYVNFNKRGVGGKKLAVYLNTTKAVNSLGPTVTYAGSMQLGLTGGQNRKVINALWFTMVRESLKISRVMAGKKGPKTVNKGYAARAIGSDTKGSARAIRLHGPTASKNIYGPTGEGNDTSVPVVSLVEALQDIKHNNFKLPKNVTNTSMYQKAFYDIIQELDNDFIINSDTISSIVNADKVIRIKLHQGGDQHQSYMAHADKSSVNHILKTIAAKLLKNPNGPMHPDYEASKSMSEMSLDAVSAQVVTGIFTKAGTPDMRYKVNKQLFAKKGRKQKTSDQGVFKQRSKGKRIAKGLMAAKSITKRSKSSTNIMGMGVEGATTSPVALKELIQAQLAERLLSNMVAPALQNRTGRFRRSAQVENVMVGPRGGTEVQYTYMKDPYSTFEPGGKMGSTDRDPRKLIGGTIREIATELTGNKFIRTRSL